MSRRKLAAVAFSGLLGIGLLALIGVGAAWDGLPRTAEARKVDLRGGVYAPVAAPPEQALAAIPSQVNFQGVLTNPSTAAAVPDGSYSIRFSVWDADTGGAELWNETQPNVSVSGGLFNVQLGEVNGFPADLFADAPRLLEVKVGTDPAMTPRLPFLSVPYAFRAEIAHAATVASDLDCAGCVAGSEVAFNYAGSTSPGGPATDVACLAPGCISSNEIVDGQVASLDITDGTITGTDISDFAGVASTDIVDSSVASMDIQDGTITGTDISDFSGVASTDIVDSTITGNDISDTSGVASADIVNGTVTGTDIANATIVSANIADNTITGTDIASNAISGTHVLDGSLASADVLDNSLTATDVAINYAGSTTEGGVANDSQLLDAVDSASFLRSDVTDAYTAGTLTFSNGTILDLRNAGIAGNIRLSNNGLDGTQTICFLEVTNCGEFFRWVDNVQFELSDDLAVTGNLMFGNTESWVDGGFNTISSNSNALFVDNSAICVDDGVNGVPADECGEISLAPGEIKADGNITANAFDLAERFAVAGEELAPGELVALDTGTQVRRSGGMPYDPRMLGIVTREPGFVLGWETGDDVPVALAGRVPLKVTLENGPIAVGDYLTSSSTPGRAMKATEPGPTIGIALEPFDGADQGQVLTFVSRDAGTSAGVIKQLRSDFETLEARVGALEDGDSASALNTNDGVSWTGLAPWLLLVLVAGTAAGASLRPAAARALARVRKGQAS